jgi:hypothetical protein
MAAFLDPETFVLMSKIEREEVAKMLKKIYTERRTRGTIVNNSNENSDVIVDENSNWSITDFVKKFSQRAAIVPDEAPTTIDSELKFFYSRISANQNKKVCQFEYHWL